MSQLPTNTVSGIYGVGAQKAGTSWLFAALGGLAAVRAPVADVGKEVNFFDIHFGCGYRWYKSRYPSARPDLPHLDVSPMYMQHPLVAQRIAEFDPGAKIIAILRDPVERAVSQHRHELRKRPGTTPLSFFDALRGNPSYIEGGRYASQLLAYRNVFEPANLHIVDFRRITATPSAVLREVVAFAGLPPIDRDLTRANMAVNAAGMARSSRARSIEVATGRLLRGIGGERLVSRARCVPALIRMRSMNLRAPSDLDIGLADEARIATLRERFSGDAQQLRDHLGLSWVDWDTAA